MKNISLCLILLLLAIVLKSQTVEQVNTKINWMTIKEAEKLQEENPKTILIDMYTDWCGWCKKFDAETFSHPTIAAYINANFYPVKFNAESKDTIIFRNNTYVNPNADERRSSHQLAQALMGGRMSYPTIVYIDSDFRANPVPGFMDVKGIEPILVYFAEKIYKNIDFQYYLKDFNNTFRPDSTSQISGNVNWMNVNEAIDSVKNSKRKMLLYINSDYNNGSKIMLGSSFKHPIIADIVNKNFFAANLNYDAVDTIKLQGNIFVNEQTSPMYPHQFVIALLQPEISLPSVVFFDEELNVIFVLKGYYPPNTLERFIDFIGNDHYKDGTDWQEFNNNFKSRIETNEQ